MYVYITYIHIHNLMEIIYKEEPSKALDSTITCSSPCTPPCSLARYPKMSHKPERDAALGRVNGEGLKPEAAGASF